MPNTLLPWLPFWLVLLLLAMPAAAENHTPPAPVTLGVVSPAAPSRVFANWVPLADELSRRLDRKVEIIIPSGLDDILRHANAGSMDFFFVNSYVYHLLKQKGLATPVAQMKNIEGSVLTQGRFITRQDNDIDSVEMMRGKRVALVSPLGAAAYLAPRAHLRELGIRIEEDVEVVFTRDLLKATYMVLHNEVDAAVMCSVNYRILDRKLDLGELKIIGDTVSFPESMIAARPGLDPGLVSRVRDILLQLDGTDSGRRALQPLHDLKVGSFVEYDPAVEQAIEQLMQAAEL